MSTTETVTIPLDSGDITVTVKPQLSGYGVRLEVRRAGEVVTRDKVLAEIDDFYRARMVRAGVDLPDRTHHIGQVVLTAEHAAAVAAAIERVRAANPEAQVIRLGSQRRGLAEAVAAVLEGAADAKARAYEDGVPQRWHQGEEAEYAAREAAARQALAEFDAEHPEIRAGEESELAAAARRRMLD